MFVSNQKDNTGTVEAAVDVIDLNKSKTNGVITELSILILP